MNPETNNSTTTSTWGRPPVWLIIGAFLNLGFISWLLLALPRNHTEVVAELLILASLALLTLWGVLQASRRPDAPLRMRHSLRLLAVSFALNVLGTASFTFAAYNQTGSPPRFGISDWVFLAAYVCNLLSLIHWPRGQRPVASPLRILVDGLIFVVGLGAPLWLFAIGPHLQEAAGLEAIFLLVWPVAAFFGIMIINQVLLTREPWPTRTAYWLILAGLGIGWLADLIGTLDASTQLLTGKVNWPNLCTAVSFGLIQLAAWRFTASPAPAVRSSIRPASLTPVPLVTLLAVSAWLFASISAPASFITMGGMLPSVILLILALFVRETLIMRDSLRWVAAEVRQKSWARFESMIQHSSDVIMLVDPQQRRIRFASPSARTTLGRSPDELIDEPLLDLLHADDMPGGRIFLDGLSRQPGTACHQNWRLRHANGHHVTFEAAGSCLDEQDGLGGYILSLRDVSERLVQEERLLHTGKMEAVSRLAGGLAHDFNNLMAVIMAHSELALLGLPDGHEVRPEVSEIRRASARGASLTGRLLSFSRREGATPTLSNPAEVLRRITPVLRQLSGDDLTVTTRIDPSTGAVAVPADSLEQALINLTTNARDFSPPGRVVIITVHSEVLSAPLPSRYLSAQPGKYVVVEIADTGSGMDEAILNRLFEPFFTTKPPGKGTGLGLAMVYGMVRTARGGVTVHSENGKGTTLKLWLPQTGAAVSPN